MQEGRTPACKGRPCHAEGEGYLQVCLEGGVWQSEVASSHPDFSFLLAAVPHLKILQINRGCQTETGCVAKSSHLPDVWEMSNISLTCCVKGVQHLSEF